MKREQSRKLGISRLCTGRGMHVTACVACILILGLAPGTAMSGESAGGAGEEDMATTAALVTGTFLNIVYFPAKVIYAAGGTLAGGLSWIFSGGNEEVAMGVIEPAVGGDYVITPSHLRGDKQLVFVGGSGGDSSRLAAVSAAPPTKLSSCDDMERIGAVPFGHNDAMLQTNAKRDLQRVAITLEECSRDSLIINGHSDATGEGPYNEDLSLRRANVVRDYLVQNGADPSRVEAVGLGASKPVSSNETQLGRAANRRVEIEVD
jgi:hypothetical protein